jgi:two-component system sensor histidine kinase DesK
MRSTVANTRLPTIEDELAQAAILLRAAGVDFKVESIKPDIPAAIETALAWAIREGVTNVIRHSQAKNCKLKISEGQDGKIQLEIENDRYTIEPGKLPPTGSGLAGLAQRVSSLGGQMEFGPANAKASGVFRLWISLPIHVE